MTARRALFWIHLTAGSAAGVVILVMSLTGIALAYERQIANWANGSYRSTPVVPGQARLPLESLLETVKSAEPAAPTAITVRSPAAEPVQLGYGRDRVLMVNAYSGTVLGEASPRLRGFFSRVEEVHRFLGATGERRGAGRAVTGACNLAFLALVLSGPFLWWPKSWTVSNLRKVVLFRSGLSGRARDWNWHNVIGIWCFAPLLLVVLTGVVMSYPWANNLLYRASGNEPPPSSQPSGARPGGERREHGAARGRLPLQAALANAQQKVPGWRSVTIRLPNSDSAPLVVVIDAGNGGRPDQRGQLTIDSRSGEVLRWEPFSSYNPGRRLRTWVRFTHSGEVGGILGQSIAATASAGAAVLVWTGLALALRRLNEWRKRFRPRVLERG